MRRLAFILLLLASLSVDAAMSLRNAGYAASLSKPVVSGSVSNFWATNYGTPVAYWVADNATLSENGGTNWVFTWPDSCASSWNLTNGAYGTSPIALTNSLNGHHVVSFDGTDDYLRNYAFTNYQPSEVLLVCNIVDGTNESFRVFDSVNGSYRNVLEDIASGMLKIYAMNNDSDTGIIIKQNQWIVYNVVFNGALSCIVSNNQTYGVAAVSPGASAMSGLTFGSRFTLTANTEIKVAEICMYRGTNVTADRTAIFTGLTNKYGITNFIW